VSRFQPHARWRAEGDFNVIFGDSQEVVVKDGKRSMHSGGDVKVGISVGPAAAFFFFDESIQPSAGFIAGAWVAWREDPTDRINDVLQTAGLQPGVDEFKPGSSPSA
jgi:hypothetical protein